MDIKRPSDLFFYQPKHIPHERLFCEPMMAFRKTNVAAAEFARDMLKAIDADRNERKV